MPHAPQPRTLRQRLGVWALQMLGWTPVMAPPPGKKFVLVGYPHTSNWDFLYALLWGLASGTHFRWVGKKELFPPVLGALMRGLGGIPVDRQRAGGAFVQQVAQLFQRSEELWLVVAAEGTRSQAPHWKTGFYYMALEAGVPIALAYLDRTRKEVGVGGYLVPSGDLEADFQRIAAFYQDKVGLKPQRQSPIRLKPKGRPGDDG